MAHVRTDEQEDLPSYEAMRVNNPAQRRNVQDDTKKSQRRSKESGMKKQAASKPTVHHFDSSIGSYDRTQTDPQIKSGDVFHIPSEGIVGYMHKAWPTAVTTNRGEFHGFDADQPAGWAGPRGEGHKVCQSCHGSGKAAPGANAPHRQEGDTSCWGCSGRGYHPGDSLATVKKLHEGWRSAMELAQQAGYPMHHPNAYVKKEAMFKEALTLSRQVTSAYTTPGYYIVDRFGAAQDGPYNTYSLAIANLNGRDAIQYLDQPTTAPLNEPFPPGMNTVFGSLQTEAAQCATCGTDIRRTSEGFWNNSDEWEDHNGRMYDPETDHIHSPTRRQSSLQMEAMKFSQEHLETLRQSVAPYDTAENRERYRSGNFPRADKVKNLDTRYRWDLYHASGAHAKLNPYDHGYNDTHIDTALKNVVPPLGHTASLQVEALSDERISDAADRHYKWAQANGHDAETSQALRAHMKAKGLTRAEADGVADLLHVSDWNPRTASAGMNLAGEIGSMKHGEQRKYSSEGHEFGVSYHERQAYGDNGQPVSRSDKYTGTTGEYTLYHPSGRSEEFHVGPSHEAKPYQAEQVAKRMMSHWTDAKIKRLNPKESSMSDQNEYEPLHVAEARILEAMASNPHESTALIAELDRVRHEAALQVQAQAEVDLGAAIVSDLLTPVPTFSRHTSSTDWLGEEGTELGDPATHMITAGSLWYQKISPEVRADREEFLIQAQGAAKREAGKFGSRANEAYSTWMDHVARLRDTSSKTANNEALLPWSAVVPPLPPSNPQGAEYNGNAVLTPGNPGQPQPLSNDAENEFAFEPDSPSTTEAMGQAGDPNSTQFWPNADATVEPNDSGSLKGRNRGNNPVTSAVHTADGSVAEQPWGSVVEPVPFPINPDGSVGSASSRENLAFYPNADATDEPNDDGADSYSAPPGVGVIGGGTAAKRVASAEHPTKEEQDAEIEATEAEIHRLKDRRAKPRNYPDSKTAGHPNQRTGSANFSGPKTSYDEYLAKISEGSHPVSREFWSGMAAAVSPNDATSRREGKVAHTTPSHPYDNGDPIGGGWGPHDVPCQACGGGADDPQHLFFHPGYGRQHIPVQGTKTAGGGMAPSRLSGEPQSHDDPDGSELGTNPLTPEPSSIWQLINYPDPVASHPPGQMAETFSTISDFPDTGPTKVPNEPVYPGRKTSASGGPGKPRGKKSENVPDQGSRTGFETGNPQRPVGTGNGFQPDRGLQAQSPKGQADSTWDYEHALSSGQSIDETATGETNLGTVPVQGYEQNADHPNGEMWPWNPNPPGTGAAAVADVPTPGMISQQVQGTSWPQPEVKRSARLDAFRQAVAERSGR